MITANRESRERLRTLDIDVIVAAPQADNRASHRALEKAGFPLADERQLDSDDPSDAGPSAIYTLTRPH
jgi:aminoglycoside 6'-N-acetyltransferase